MKREPPEYIEVTKREAAIRQIVRAIDAFWKGEYDVSITLALAAEGMAGQSNDSLFARQIAHLPDGFTKREWVSIVNGERDWLKHPTTEILGQEIKIEWHAAGFAIARALHRWPGWTDSMNEFKLWYIDRLRNDFTNPE